MNEDTKRDYSLGHLTVILGSIIGLLASARNTSVGTCLANLVISNPCLSLQTLKEAVERLGLVVERTQETHHTGLFTHFPQYADDDPVHGGVLT